MALIAIITIVIVVAVIIWAVWGESDSDIVISFAVVVGLGCVCAISIPLIATSTSSAAQLEADYENLVFYDRAVSETGALFSEGGTDFVEGNIERLAQGQSVSDRIAERRSFVTSFNRRLAQHRRWQNNFLAWPFWVDVSDDVQPIK